uniref:Uncharacterized protein n=1 Tax=Aegilops tauschii TaxID=37682 RepID=M8BFF1_AEGTA
MAAPALKFAAVMLLAALCTAALAPAASGQPTDALATCIGRCGVCALPEREGLHRYLHSTAALRGQMSLHLFRHGLLVEKGPIVPVREGLLSRFVDRD